MIDRSASSLSPDVNTSNVVTPLPPALLTPPGREVAIDIFLDNSVIEVGVGVGKVGKGREGKAPAVGLWHCCRGWLNRRGRGS